MSLIVYAIAALSVIIGACANIATPDSQPAPDPLEIAADSINQERAEQIIAGVETLPLLIGGLAALRKELKYPQEASDAGIEGRVIVGFVVDEKGRPGKIEVLNGLCASCDAEAIRLVAQARFVPGYTTSSQGKPVAMRMSLPIDFKLPRK